METLTFVSSLGIRGVNSYGSSGNGGIVSILYDYTKSSLSFAVTAFLGCSIPLSYVLYRRLKDYQSKLPPLAPGSFYSTIVNLTDNRAPDWLLNLSRIPSVGVIFRLQIPELNPWVVVADPELARIIFEEEPEKPAVYKKFRAATKGIDTMFTRRTYHDQWDTARKGIAPSFSMLNIYRSLPKVYEKMEKLKQVLLVHVAKQDQVDIAELMIRLTLDCITAAMYDVDWSTLGGSSDSTGRVLLDGIRLSIKEFALKEVFNPLRPLFFWDQDRQRAVKATAEIFNLQQKLLDDFRSKRTAEELQKDPSILGHICRTPYASDVERCADMVMFLLGGHDTTGYTIAWTLIEVAKHPEVLRKIQEEIAREVPRDVAQLDATKHLPGMTYLDDVIKESMRLWPVGALGSTRLASKEIRYKDFVIPKGSSIMIPFYLNFRTQAIYDPDTFKPERWSVAADAEQLQHLFWPFALGKRNCIGQNLAKLETKLVLATLLRSFRLELKREVQSEYFLTIRPVDAFVTVHSVDIYRKQ